MNNPKPRLSISRRRFLGATAAASAFPYLWIPRDVQAAAGRGTAKHLLYIRLSGGFRFPTAFNGDVAEEFNPFGLASGVASGTQWGVGRMLAQNAWLTEELAPFNLRTVPTFANEIAVLGCVDHEPLAGSADGNHNTGLERFLTGYVGGETGLFTMINYGLRERTLQAEAEGNVLLPAIIMGEAVMGRGTGVYAAHRPPVLRGDDLDRFSAGAAENLPVWARGLSDNIDRSYREAQAPSHRGTVDAYIRSREATRAYAQIFASDILKVGERSQDAHDGVSNDELAQVFGENGVGRSVSLALRLFHFGCPAVYIDQGAYDLHSDEEENLPGRMEEFNRILSGLHWALKRMQHPSGGTYWDHTIVLAGSEFSRSTRGSRFNSARGSDHGGDLATRWMSMPFMGGPVTARGRAIGTTNRQTFAAEGPVFSYRAMWKTMLDALGADHTEFFPADAPFDDLFV